MVTPDDDLFGWAGEAVHGNWYVAQDGRSVARAEAPAAHCATVQQAQVRSAPAATATTPLTPCTGVGVDW